MKKNFTLIVLALCGIGLMYSSCSKKSGMGDRSSKTGMKYNDPHNGGFQVNRKVKPGPGPGLVIIEGGTFVMGGSLDQDLGYENDNKRRRVTVASFYMDETEVANVDWLEYLYWLNQNFPNDRQLYYNALPDTLVWRNPLSYNEPYVDNYLRHPAYQDYPVVGVTWEQANDYCVWRTDRVNEEILRSKGILLDYKSKAESAGESTAQPFNTDIYLNGQYKGEGIDGKNMPKDLRPGAEKDARRPVRLEDGFLKQPYRLPTEAEWEYAALGLIGNTIYGNVEGYRIYPWDGLGVRSGKKKTQGLIMANFKLGAGDNMGTAGYLNDAGDITKPVTAYQPNDFGLYNMAGNVNEWVGDVYRKLTYEDFEDFNPFRGNVYVDKKLEDPEKGIYAKDKYGRPIKEMAKAPRKQTWEELQNQTAAQDSGVSAYNADMRGYNDEVSDSLYGKTTLVNNKSRVYKGGSWNDRAYWLNPATRRFMQQDESSATVGFRCAMTLVGNPEIHTNGMPRFKSAKVKSGLRKSSKATP
ncbi:MULTISPECIES: SUMF1/EgtB/PvdO family nonheme iron enzyme [Olivibacter]|jgi:gliding motility-associated lipoprotein GldJ|uniref:Sulphatase-modifying factor protein n=3 Tax=Sphingobacteriaceae TaxID=84566 RepID=F4C595_SPHS2|nr:MULTISPECIES: SUMF1/EgtB/PvdO family nonheme iron enzyme [Olivibacter]MCL4639440.1 SUMF1/EgtB/PvdO family nonheme iron enzyme [Olivibacter sp. UJ_SKK_5.1]MDM8176993.1 SUMF1/EgtB/PvdO family nonheme iron enzyme [Olivibacter sp. 47]MDX3912489.1 SUMF1/EgtB/PvdO family nonheme iron enzyme [Pseudosphingobacterium sp.]QEL00208.1 SUMF1/EgtB/PvdOfamily nonheme iron enzyme [Olivibacter sp. LS-1]